MPRMTRSQVLELEAAMNELAGIWLEDEPELDEFDIGVLRYVLHVKRHDMALLRDGSWIDAGYMELFMDGKPVHRCFLDCEKLGEDLERMAEGLVRTVFRI